MVELNLDFDRAQHKISSAAQYIEPSVKRGRHLFLSRCVMCHGTYGRGDGRVAAALSPKPANLTVTQLSNAELKSIITKGGAKSGRSPQMPEWGLELLEFEIDSLVAYIDGNLKGSTQ